MVSVTPSGAEGGSTSGTTRRGFSGDNRYVAFYSIASDLVAGDLNGKGDVFLRDLNLGATSLVSLGSSGNQGNATSGGAAISGDGRFLVFGTPSTNMAPGATNGLGDVYLRDLRAGTTTWISSGLGGVEANSKAGAMDLSADGSVIVFASLASNMVLGDTNGTWDIFVHEVATGTTTRVSVDSQGNESNGLSINPMISADGRFVCFESSATNLDRALSVVWPRAFVHDRQTGVTEAVFRDLQGDKNAVGGMNPVISSDGRYVVFDTSLPNLVPNDTNNQNDVFVFDRQTETTVRASVSSGGVEGDGQSLIPTISASGRFVAFRSSSTNLVPGDTNNVSDIFVRDLLLGVTTRASIGPGGIQAEVTCQEASISPDGSMVCFESASWTLVPGASNIWKDVFLRTCPPVGTQTYCVAQTNTLGCKGEVSFTGTPSASAGSGFDLDASNVRNAKLGTLFYGLNGPALIPFQGGSLCVAPPLRRTPLLFSGGSPASASNCSGTFSMDFNSHAASGKDPTLTAGASVRAQFWSRDAGAPTGTNLTDAVLFTLAP